MHSEKKKDISPHGFNLLALLHGLSALTDEKRKKVFAHMIKLMVQGITPRRLLQAYFDHLNPICIEAKKNLTEKGMVAPRKTETVQLIHYFISDFTFGKIVRLFEGLGEIAATKEGSKVIQTNLLWLSMITRPLFYIYQAHLACSKIIIEKGEMRLQKRVESHKASDDKVDLKSTLSFEYFLDDFKRFIAEQGHTEIKALENAKAQYLDRLWERLNDSEQAWDRCIEHWMVSMQNTMQRIAQDSSLNAQEKAREIRPTLNLLRLMQTLSTVSYVLHIIGSAGSVYIQTWVPRYAKALEKMLEKSPELKGKKKKVGKMIAHAAPFLANPSLNFSGNELIAAAFFHIIQENDNNEGMIYKLLNLLRCFSQPYYAMAKRPDALKKASESKQFFLFCQKTLCIDVITAKEGVTPKMLRQVWFKLDEKPKKDWSEDEKAKFPALMKMLGKVGTKHMVNRDLMLSILHGLFSQKTEQLDQWLTLFQAHVPEVSQMVRLIVKPAQAAHQVQKGEVEQALNTIDSVLHPSESQTLEKEVRKWLEWMRDHQKPLRAFILAFFEALHQVKETDVLSIEKVEWLGVARRMGWTMHHVQALWQAMNRNPKLLSALLLQGKMFHKGDASIHQLLHMFMHEVEHVLKPICDRQLTFQFGQQNQRALLLDYLVLMLGQGPDLNREKMASWLQKGRMHADGALKGTLKKSELLSLLHHLVQDQKAYDQAIGSLRQLFAPHPTTEEGGSKSEHRLKDYLYDVLGAKALHDLLKDVVRKYSPEKNKDSSKESRDNRPQIWKHVLQIASEEKESTKGLFEVVIHTFLQSEISSSDGQEVESLPEISHALAQSMVELGLSLLTMAQRIEGREYADEAKTLHRALKQLVDGDAMASEDAGAKDSPAPNVFNILKTEALQPWLQTILQSRLKKLACTDGSSKEMPRVEVAWVSDFISKIEQEVQMLVEKPQVCTLIENILIIKALKDKEKKLISGARAHPKDREALEKKKTDLKKARIQSQQQCYALLLDVMPKEQDQKTDLLKQLAEDDTFCKILSFALQSVISKTLYPNLKDMPSQASPQSLHQVLSPALISSILKSASSPATEFLTEFLSAKKDQTSTQMALIVTLLKCASSQEFLGLLALASEKPLASDEKLDGAYQDFLTHFKHLAHTPRLDEKIKKIADEEGAIDNKTPQAWVDRMIAIYGEMNVTNMFVSFAMWINQVLEKTASETLPHASCYAIPNMLYVFLNQREHLFKQVKKDVKHKKSAKPMDLSVVRQWLVLCCRHQSVLSFVRTLLCRDQDDREEGAQEGVIEVLSSLIKALDPDKCSRVLKLIPKYGFNEDALRSFIEQLGQIDDLEGFMHTLMGLPNDPWAKKVRTLFVEPSAEIPPADGPKKTIDDFLKHGNHLVVQALKFCALIQKKSQSSRDESSYEEVIHRLFAGENIFANLLQEETLKSLARWVENIDGQTAYWLPHTLIRAGVQSKKTTQKKKKSSFWHKVGQVGRRVASIFKKAPNDSVLKKSLIDWGMDQIFSGAKALNRQVFHLTDQMSSEQRNKRISGVLSAFFKGLGRRSNLVRKALVTFVPSYEDDPDRFEKIQVRLQEVAELLATNRMVHQLISAFALGHIASMKDLKRKAIGRIITSSLFIYGLADLFKSIRLMQVLKDIQRLMQGKKVKEKDWGIVRWLSTLRSGQFFMAWVAFFGLTLVLPLYLISHFFPSLFSVGFVNVMHHLSFGYLVLGVAVMIYALFEGSYKNHARTHPWATFVVGSVLVSVIGLAIMIEILALPSVLVTCAQVGGIMLVAWVTIGMNLLMKEPYPCVLPGQIFADSKELKKKIAHPLQQEQTPQSGSGMSLDAGLNV